MALDPSIILRGQPLDVVGAMRQGNAAAAETNALRQQNALAQLYQTQGQGLLQGNPQSLNALARIDPNAALGIKSGQMDMQATQQRMDMLTREEQRQIEALKASKSQEELAAAAAQIEDAVKMGLAIQTPEQWDAVMQTQAPELVGQFGNKQALAMKYMSMAEALKAATPQTINPNDRFKVVGSTLFDLGAKGGPAPVGQGAMPEETIMGPDGKPLIIRGGPGAAAKFTEAQGKDNVFATRATGALAKLEQPMDPNNPEAGVMADSLSVLQDSAVNRVPIVGNYLTSDNFQVARTAADEFLQAILRKDTGAAITPAEQDLYGVTYLPQPGDSKARLDYKREARARAVAALQSGMSQAQLDAVARADKAVLEQIGGNDNASPPPAVDSNIPADAVQLLRQNNTEEYRKFFDEVFGEGAAARALGGN